MSWEHNSFLFYVTQFHFIHRQIISTSTEVFTFDFTVWNRKLLLSSSAEEWKSQWLNDKTFTEWTTSCYPAGLHECQSAHPDHDRVPGGGFEGGKQAAARRRPPQVSDRNTQAGDITEERLHIRRCSGPVMSSWWMKSESHDGGVWRGWASPQ